MDINYEYYKVFYYAAKYKNITKAAAALGSSQPNVTRVMKLLESALQCRLFVREARGVVLTEEGERLYGHVKIAVSHIQDAQEELLAREMSGTGTVEIGATETALHLFLLEALQGFKELYPKARIKIHNHTTPEILKNLAYGRLDFAVLTTPVNLQKSFVSKELFSFREILVAGKQYGQLANRVWQLQELETCSWVGLGEGTATYEMYKEFFMKNQADISLDMEAASSDLLIPLIQNNFGIGFVPQALAEPLTEAGSLVKIALSCGLPERKICLVYDKGRGRSAIGMKLQDYLSCRTA